MRRKRRSKAVGRRRGRPPAVGRVDVKLPRGLVQRIEELVADRIYLSKADFVRSAVREKLTAGARPSADQEKE